MIIKLEINGVEKDVKIKGIGVSHRDDYYKKVITMEKFQEDENMSTEDKLKKADEFIKWLLNLCFKKSDLTEDEKKLVEDDLEESDKIVAVVREILQPLSEAKKK